MDQDLALELNGGGDEEEALRRAIALSMGQPETQKQDDGNSASGTHKAGSSPSKPTQIDLTDSPPTKSEDKECATQDPARSNTHSFMGLNRRQMEEERLARLKKRKTADSMDETEQASQAPNKRPAIGGIVPPYLTRAIEEYRAANKGQKEGESSDQVSEPKKPQLPFPKGAVKRTWVRSQAKGADDITIEEVLQKESLDLAVLSSFQWDENWLFSKLDTRKTKVLLIAFASSESEKEAMRANVPSNIIRFCFPPMLAMGCMHSKLQLLKYPDYLRIVVPTGNLVNYDWGETGVMENMVFLIDLPRIPDTIQQEGRQLTSFGDDLCYFLKAQGVEESLIKSLNHYDFTETSRYGFVHSIAGSHWNESWKRTGYCGLGRAVDSLGLRTSTTVEVDFACSSVGSLNGDLMLALYYACQGDSGMKEYDARVNRPKKAKSATEVVPWTDHFRIYFPSKATVLASRGGKNAAGTICLQDRWWNAATFPKTAFRDLKNVKPGILSHSKALFVRKQVSESSLSPGWAYLGSANMSESAWGRLVRDKASAKPKLTCRNWECGVLIPASGSNSAAAQTAGEGVHMLHMFATTVPVPMVVPGARFVANDGAANQPWFFLEA